MGCNVTTNVAVAVWDKLPLRPLMVNVLVPVGVFAAVVMFNVELPVDDGLGVKSHSRRGASH